MILTPQEAFELIKTPKNKVLIEQAKKIHLELNMQVNGVGVVNYLEKIDGYENDEQLKLRKKLARSNKITYSKLLRTTDKVFSAKGGSKVYDMPDSLKEGFQSKEYKGYSISKWIELVGLGKYITDPNGLFFIEKDAEGEPYPTYKSTIDLYDYEVNGKTIEYIIFMPEVVTKDGVTYKKYRVVDQEKDMVLNVYGDTFTLNDMFAINGTIPAMVISSTPSETKKMMKSPVEVTLEVANEMLQITTTKNIYINKHLYPIFWRYLEDCPECNGTGYKDGNKCSKCSGSGKKLTKDVSDIIGLPFPQSNNDVTVAPNIAGFIQPELETLVAINNELLIKYKEIEFGIWGSNYERATNETATGKWIDSQPVFDALQHFSNWAENTEKRLTDFIGGILYKGAYKTCSIVYGKRYMIEPADIIFTKYLDAKGKGAPKATLDNYLIQYYHTLYETDSSMLNKMIIRLKCEPFTHNTVDEVKGWNVDEIDYLKKVYYPEWEKTVPETEWTTDNYEKLDKSLTDYVLAKKEPEQVDSVGGIIAEAESIQQSALNGAQISSLLEVINGISTKQLPIAAGEAIIQSAFPTMPIENIQRIMKSLSGFKPAVITNN